MKNRSSIVALVARCVKRSAIEVYVLDAGTSGARCGGDSRAEPKAAASGCSLAIVNHRFLLINKIYAGSQLVVGASIKNAA
jgi:hypothetical protein